MLRTQPWIKLAPDLPIEWRQCMDEGLDVGDLETKCIEAAALDENAAAELFVQIHSRPVRGGYRFREPSDLNRIREERPADRSFPYSTADEKEMRDRLYGAWLGRISGCLLGKPVEGFRSDDLAQLLRATENDPMNRYIMRKDIPQNLKDKYDADGRRCFADTVGGTAPADDDTNYTVLALRLLENYGWNFTPEDVLENWLTRMPYLAACTAERIAYRNAAAGLLPPETAVVHNPYREWVGAQIRADFYGYICPGQPEKAAGLAFRDASVSHVKNGIYGAMYTAALIAAAAVCGDRKKVIGTGLAEIPENCRLQDDLQRVLHWYESGVTADQVVTNIHKQYNERSAHDWCHTNSNAMIVTAALLYGNGDFGRTVCLAVGSAFDTDCNGATVGSVLGMMLGRQGIPAQWTDPHGGRLRTSVEGDTLVTVDNLVERTIRVMNR